MGGGPPAGTSWDDLDLAELIVSNGLCSRERVDECLAQRAQRAANGEEPPGLVQLLVDRGYLTPNRVRAAEAATDPTSRAGKYLRVSRLGVGGMGEVWRAWDSELQRWIALKTLRHDLPQERARFIREARTAARLSHPNIATIHDVGEADGEIFIAMQLVDGRTLKSCSESRRRVAEHVRDAALAVHYAHEQGVVHRDLKPDNIMVDRAGRVFVMDFGLAKPMAPDESLTASGLMVGTPGYAAPEQVRANETAVGPRSDVYGLGGTLYDLVAGRRPFEGTDMFDLMAAVMTEDPVPLSRVVPGIDRDLDTIVMKCLEKDPQRRYATALELADDLSRYLRGEPIVARPPSTVYRFVRAARRRITPTHVGVAGLVCVAVVVAVLLPRLLAARAEALRERARREEAYLYLPLEKELDLLRMKSYQPRHTLAEEFERYDDLIRRIRGQAAGSGSAEGPYLIGRCLAAIARHDEADAAYAEALSRDPGHARALLARGRLGLERALIRHAMSGGDSRRRAARVDDARRAVEQVRRGAELSGAAASMEMDLALAYLAAMEKQGAGGFGARAFETWKGRPLAEEFLLLDGIARGGVALAGACDDVIDRVPRWSVAYLWRGLVRRDRGDVDGAMADFDTTLAINPRDAEALLSRAVAHQDRRDYGRALEDLDEAVRLRPGDPDAYVNRGVVRVDAIDIAGALADYARALELNPGDALAINNRGTARLKQGDVDSAMADYEEAVRLDPRLAGARINRGAARLCRGELVGAMADLDEAVRLGPGIAEGWMMRGVTRKERGDLDGALADLDEAVRLKPSNAEARIRRGLVFSARGEHERALADYDHAVRLDPLDPVARNNRGLSRREKRDLAGAVEDFAEAIRLKPGYAAAHLNRANVHLLREDTRAALADFDEVIRLEPRHGEARGSRGLILFELGDIPRALADFNRALEIDPRNTTARLNRGLARQTGGDVAGALADFDEVIRLDGRDAEAHGSRGFARLDRGDRAGAAADLERALELGGPGWPHRTRVEQALRELQRR